jgi:RND family efflux transporter MFP subunit
LASSRSSLADATIRAPFDGVISERSVSQGDVVSPGTPLITVIDPASMRLEATVPSEQLSALSVAAPVRFEVRGYPNQSFVGRIASIAPAVDPATRQIAILVDIPNPGGKLVAGLFAVGRIDSDAPEGLATGSEAVDLSGVTPTVTRVRDGVVERVPVKLGVRDVQAERIELLSGVAAGDILLIHGAQKLAPGTRVTLANSPAHVGGTR